LFFSLLLVTKLISPQFYGSNVVFVRFLLVLRSPAKNMPRQTSFNILSLSVRTPVLAFGMVNLALWERDSKRPPVLQSSTNFGMSYPCPTYRACNTF
jgi:hypothetical protein